MNKILSSVLISAIASTVTLSAATAVIGEDVPSADRLSTLYINPLSTGGTYNTATLATTNEISHDYNVSVDLPGVGQEIELVWQPYVNLTPGSKFTLRANDANFVLDRDVVLCNDGTIVGTMVSVGAATGITNTMNNMSFRINDNIIAANAAKDNNITFSTTTSCDTTAMLELTSTAASCTALTVEIPQAIDDSSQAFTDYTASSLTIGETKVLVKVACDTPVCTIDAAADYKTFTDTAASTGINNKQVQSIASRDVSAYCPECVENISDTCVTTITVKNGANFDITSLEVTPEMLVNSGMLIDVTFDANTTESDKAMNALITLSDINITNGDEKNITVTYKPLENSTIAEGTVASAITLKAGTVALNLDRTAMNLATFAVAGQTVFTVPYMNSTYKSMVKITTLGTETATLTAVITDQDGRVSPSIDCGTIAAGATKFLFSTSGPLKAGADAADLKNAWSVVFTTSAEATVVATMAGPDGGDRAISVF